MGRSPAEWPELLGHRGLLAWPRAFGLILVSRMSVPLSLTLRLCPLITPESSHFPVVIVPEFLWTLRSLCFPSQVVFSVLCVFVDFFPLSPFALLFLWFSDISVSLDKYSSYQKNIKNDSFPFSFLSTSVFCSLHLTIFCSGGPVCSQGRLSLCSRRILTRDSLMLTWNWSPFYIISISPRLGLWSCRNYYGFSPIVPSSYIKEN